MTARSVVRILVRAFIRMIELLLMNDQEFPDNITIGYGDSTLFVQVPINGVPR